MGRANVWASPDLNRLPVKFVLARTLALPVTGDLSRLRIADGQKAGQLEQMLERVADTYESEVDTKLSRLTALLEPLMLVVMGGAVAFIVFSILQPIMDLGQLSGPH